MAEKPQFSSSRVSSITGKTGSKKKDGYAAGSVPSSMLGTKAGKVEGEGYSGPNVTRATRA